MQEKVWCAHFALIWVIWLYTYRHTTVRYEGFIVSVLQNIILTSIRIFILQIFSRSLCVKLILREMLFIYEKRKGGYDFISMYFISINKYLWGGHHFGNGSPGHWPSFSIYSSKVITRDWLYCLKNLSLSFLYFFICIVIAAFNSVLLCRSWAWIIMFMFLFLFFFLKSTSAILISAVGCGKKTTK